MRVIVALAAAAMVSGCNHGPNMTAANSNPPNVIATYPIGSTPKYASIRGDVPEFHAALSACAARGAATRRALRDRAEILAAARAIEPGADGVIRVDVAGPDGRPAADQCMASRGFVAVR